MIEQVHDSKAPANKNPKKMKSPSKNIAQGGIKKYLTKADCWMFFIFIFFIIFFGILFFINRYCWDTHSTLDNNLFGTYGDFVGGVVGTLIAFVAMVLMVHTLQSQQKYSEQANDINKESNKLIQIQIFENQFHSFFNLYKSSVDDYSVSHCISVIKGRDALDKICKGFLNKNFKSNASYKDRVSAACKLYEDFYASQSDKMSTHFRMLYQLVSFIRNADYIEEGTRVDYAKAVRGNLTKSEMILLRYNCFCTQGQKMKQYVNEYNLLKHIPLMRLFEFRKWADLLKSDTNNYTQAMEVMFVSLRKKICKVVETIKDNEDSLECGDKWVIKVSYNHSEHSLHVKIIDGNINGETKSTAKSNIEKAFSKLGMDNLAELFEDYFRELFFISNFSIYNKGMQIKNVVEKNSDGLNQIYFSCTSNYPLIMSQQKISPPQLND